MKSSARSRRVIWVIGLAAISGCVEWTKPTAQVTSTGGPDIQQATLEPYDGPKARLAVSRFVVKAAKAYGTIGDGLADMLATALFQSNRYIVLERQALGDVLAEQDLGASGRVTPDTAAKLGKIEGAELLVMGTVTEFEPGSAGAGASVGGALGSAAGSVLGPAGCVAGYIAGVVAGSIQTSHVAIDLKIVDTRTSRVVAVTSVEGKATDIAGLGAIAGTDLGVGLSGYAKTPMEKAVRVAIQEAVKEIVSKTPAQYYRYEDPQMAAPPAPPPGGQTQPRSPVPSSPDGRQPSGEQPKQPGGVAPPPRVADFFNIIYVKVDSVNLRSGPGTNFKRIGSVPQGAKLIVLEEKEDWLRIRQEDGKEGWIKGEFTKKKP